MIEFVKTGEVYYSFDASVVNKSGDMQPVALVTSPINSEDGSVSGLTVLISNILLI